MRDLAEALAHARLLTGERDGRTDVGEPVDDCDELSVAPTRKAGKKKAPSKKSLLEKAQQHGLQRLQLRLKAYQKASGWDPGSSTATLANTLCAPESAQYSTASASLHALQEIHLALLDAPSSSRLPPSRATSSCARHESTTRAAPHLSVRDHATIGTLLSIFNTWCMDLLTARYDAAHHQLVRAQGGITSVAQTSELRNRLNEVGGADDPDTISLRAQAEIKLAHVSGLVVLVKIQELLEMRRRSLVSPGGALPPDKSNDGTSTDGTDTPERPAKEEKATKKSSGARAMVFFMPSTYIATTLLNTCAGHILKLSFRLAYGIRMPEEPSTDKVDWHGLPMSVIQAILQTITTIACFSALSVVTSRKSTIDSTSKISKELSAFNEISEARPVPAPPTPGFVSAQATRFLAAQLLRKDGIQSMLIVMLKGNPNKVSLSAEGDVDYAPSQAKLNRILGLLLSPPKGVGMDAYADVVVPQLLNIIMLFSPLDSVSKHSPLSSIHGTTATMALAAIVEVEPAAVRQLIARRLCFPLVPLSPDANTMPFGQGTADDGEGDELLVPFDSLCTAVGLLLAIGTLADPNPDFLHVTIEPYVVPLLSLIGFLREKNRPKIVPHGDMLDALERSASAVLRTWGRMASSNELVEKLGFGPRGLLRDNLFDVSLRGVRGRWRWRWDEQAQPCVTVREDDDIHSDIRHLVQSLENFSICPSPDGPDINPSKADSVDISNGFNAELVAMDALLSYLDNHDARLELVAQILDEYVQLERMATERTPAELMRSFSLLWAAIKYLQNADNDLLTLYPEKLLAFIDHAIDAGEEETFGGETMVHSVPFRARARGKDDEDSRDAMRQAAEILKGGMRPTAVSLLANLLMKNETITTTNTPLLRSIAHKVEKLANGEDEVYRKPYSTLLLFLEARAKLVAERGLTSAPMRKLEMSPEERAEDQYKEALQLLQDPVVPVRAHGIVLLKELVATLEVGRKADNDKLKLDPKRLPAILSLMLHAVRDDDSYVYLNAVKGLAQFGLLNDTTMLQRLVKLYTTGQDDASAAEPFTASTVDKRLRIGEALQQIIQQLGEALAPKLASVVPPLMAFLRDAQVPVPLRVSAISLLGTAVEATSAAMAAAGYGNQLASTVLDLLEVEASSSVSSDESDKEITLLDDALSRDSRLPELRRAALLLLAFLIAGSGHQLSTLREIRANDAEITISSQPETLQALRLPNGSILPSISSVEVGKPRISMMDSSLPAILLDQSLLPRIKTVCAYVQQIEVDTVSRTQAGECVEEVQALELEFVHAGVLPQASR
ncbi:hypothetical protein K437DRAFT_268016 [Tilletiaria anomala UBC 951]|uniref:RNA polymerase II assembly factor Rtp1 C-terminal domain-containing protein n=1 Tax=Tilletiaria anomala (strain ATCC 24038 / CBS 436.72 / UBC 951) TaxID=1037660 RepID=A0A066W2M3_TILAU|nr:uncharacterized protein K437DRAFT_268016 [Tilletiaria anomala UBC 951]KDN46793.1 hypothetical protein K437DRAFT_268016 [Tilletiaria anomala UBC 951]